MSFPLRNLSPTGPLYITDERVRCKGAKCIKMVFAVPGTEAFCPLCKIGNKSAKAKEAFKAAAAERELLQRNHRLADGRKWKSNLSVTTPARPTPAGQMTGPRNLPGQSRFMIRQRQTFVNVANTGIRSVDRPRIGSGTEPENSSRSRLRNTSLSRLENAPRSRTTIPGDSRPQRGSASGLHYRKDSDNDSLPGIGDLFLEPVAKKAQPHTRPAVVQPAVPLARFTGDNAIQTKTGPRTEGSKKDNKVKATTARKSRMSNNNRPVFDSDSEDDGRPLEYPTKNRFVKAKTPVSRDSSHDSSNEVSGSSREIAAVAPKEADRYDDSFALLDYSNYLGRHTSTGGLNAASAPAARPRRAVRDRIVAASVVQEQTASANRPTQRRRANPPIGIKFFKEALLAKSEITKDGVRYRIPTKFYGAIKEAEETEDAEGADEVLVADSVRAGAFQVGVGQNQAGTFAPPAESVVGSVMSKMTMPLAAKMNVWHEKEDEGGMFVQDGDELLEAQTVRFFAGKASTKRALSPGGVSVAPFTAPKKLGRFMQSILAKQQKDAAKVQIQVLVPSYEPDKDAAAVMDPPKSTIGLSRKRSASLATEQFRDDAAFHNHNTQMMDRETGAGAGRNNAIKSNKRMRQTSPEDDNLDIMDFVAQLGAALEAKRAALSLEIQAADGAHSSDENQPLNEAHVLNMAQASNEAQGSIDIRSQLDLLYAEYQPAKESLKHLLEDPVGMQTSLPRVIELARQIDAIEEQQGKGADERRPRLWFEL